MSFRLPIVMAVTALGCRDRQVSDGARSAPIETAIARDLTARFGTSVTAHCAIAGAIPIACKAVLAGGVELPIRIENVSASEWGWHVDGLVIKSAQLVAYVTSELATLELERSVTCGPPLQFVRPGGRVACTLSEGGAAFVQIAADGSTTLELALDPTSAAARSELVTPDRDRALTEQSKALEALDGESDGEEAVPTDGGMVPP